jgi:DNA-binding LacI/PurR family transcriptional regulator
MKKVKRKLTRLKNVLIWVILSVINKELMMPEKIGIRELKVKRVTEYLLNILLPLPCGSRLPGIRTIMKETGTGRLTVANALQELVRMGYIQIKPDRGIFRIKPTEKTDEIRLLHWARHSPDYVGFVEKLFYELESQAAKSGRRITLEHVGRRSAEEVTEELIRHGVSRCIIYGAASVDFTRYLHKHMQTCLELLPRHTQQTITELRDSPDVTVMQVNYLLRKGYRRIGYIHYGGKNISLYPVQTMRLLDYYRLMAENGLRVNPQWVFHCQANYENLEEGLEQIMSSDPAPEVLIVCGYAVIKVCEWCRKKKIQPGKDLAIFSVDDFNDLLPTVVTTITNNPAEIAQTFWQMFQQAERGEKVENAYTKLFILTGQTVPSRNEAE